MRIFAVALAVLTPLLSGAQAAETGDVHRLIEILCPKPIPRDGWCERKLIADGTIIYTFVHDPGSISRLQIIVDPTPFAKASSRKARVIIDHSLRGRPSMGMILVSRSEFYFERDDAIDGAEFKTLYQKLYDDFVYLGVAWLTEKPLEKVVVLKAGRPCGYKSEALARKRFFLTTC